MVKVDLDEKDLVLLKKAKQEANQTPIEKFEVEEVEETELASEETEEETDYECGNPDCDYKQTSIFEICPKCGKKNNFE